jgi:two-component system cell cycle response regulator
MPGHVLVVDPVSTNRIILKVKLATACYRVENAASAEEAMALARRGRPDCILCDGELPGGGAEALARALRADPECRDLPLLVVTGQHDAARREDAFRAGADSVLEKPLDEAMLLGRVRALIRATARRRDLHPGAEAQTAMGFAEAAAPAPVRAPRISVIAPAAPRAERWRNRIAALGQPRCEALAAGDALAVLARSAPPDLVFLDPGPGGARSALRLLSELQSRDFTRDAATAMVADPEDKAAGIVALDMGLGDLIETGTGDGELALRLTRLVRQKQEADRLRSAVGDGLRMAALDPLTGLYNRRYAMQRLEEIAETAVAEDRTFAVMVLDLDRFKQVNDQHGHAAGDMVLRTVARRIRAALRKDDLIARIGGEEFIVALPRADLAEARDLAERLRRRIGGRPVRLPNGGGFLDVTLSIGVALGGRPDRPGTAAALAVERADKALFAAKTDGRNQVTVGQTAA